MAKVTRRSHTYPIVRKTFTKDDVQFCGRPDSEGFYLVIFKTKSHIKDGFVHEANLPRGVYPTTAGSSSRSHYDEIEEEFSFI